MRALRRDPSSADSFPQDVLELQAYLRGDSRIPGVDAVPGKGTDVPLYILGSSLFGAKLAALLGLPYAFASHFAPQSLEEAVQLYRNEYQPSEQHPEPHIIAGVGVIAADTADEAAELFEQTKRQRVVQMVGRGRTFTDDEIDLLLDSPAGMQVLTMLRYTAVGTADEVRDYLDAFTERAQADELIVVSSAPGRAAWLRSLELVAQVSGLVPA